MLQPKLPWALKLGAVVLVILGPVALIAGFFSGSTGLHAFGAAMQGAVILTTGILILVHHKHTVQISIVSAVLFTIACATHGLTIFDIVQIGLIWGGCAWYRRWRVRVDIPPHVAAVRPGVQMEQSPQPAAATPESLDGHSVRPAMRHELDVDDPLEVLAQAYADAKPLEQRTNSKQAPAASAAAPVEQPVVVDGGDAALMSREPMTAGSRTGLIWIVSALTLLIGLAVISVLWSEKQKQEKETQERVRHELYDAMLGSGSSKQTDTPAGASPKDGGRSLSAPDPGKASAAKQTSRRANKDPAELGGRLVSPAADKPKNDAVLGSAYTVSACPPSLPAGTKPKLFSPEELKKVVGTEAELSADYWSSRADNDHDLWETRLKVLNGTKHCISAIELELTLQYRGIPLKERHTVSFEPILGPGQEGHEYLTLHRRTKKNGDPLGLQEWRVTKVWGFHYPTSD